MRVSIIIPAFNAEFFIARAIESALAQDHPNTEIILVDNNSIDATPAIIRNYARDHPGKIIAIEAKEQGCSQARNAGFKRASGEWIAFLDADDAIAPNRISHQLSLLQADTRWVISAYRHHFRDGSTEDSIPNKDPWRGLVRNFEIGFTSSNLIHREALIAIGGWDESLPDNTDPDLHFRLLKNETAYLLDSRILSHYHHHLLPRVSTYKPIGRLARKADFHRDVNQYLAHNKATYWQQHAIFFQSCELAALRMLATYDLADASKRFTTSFPNGVEAIDQNVLTKIPLLYRYLGFQQTEWLRKKSSALLPEEWIRSFKRRL